MCKVRATPWKHGAPEAQRLVQEDFVGVSYCHLRLDCCRLGSQPRAPSWLRRQLLLERPCHHLRRNRAPTCTAVAGTATSGGTKAASKQSHRLLLVRWVGGRHVDMGSWLCQELGSWALPLAADHDPGVLFSSLISKCPALLHAAPAQQAHLQRLQLLRPQRLLQRIISPASSSQAAAECSHRAAAELHRC